MSALDLMRLVDWWMHRTPHALTFPVATIPMGWRWGG